MRIAFRISFGLTFVLSLEAYAFYTAMMYFIDSGEGGDAIGPMGLLCFIALLVSPLVSFMSSMFTLGLWFAEKNRRSEDRKLLES